MRSPRNLITLSIIFVSFSAPTFADESDFDILKLSLNQLLNVQVISKTEENILNSPGIASTYYPEQLKRIGIYSVEDLIDFSTGSKKSNSVNGTKIYSIRGLEDSYNQKIALLVDGIPYWMPSHGDIPINGIPFDSIKRVEVLRGPASVLYGSNASSGVINLVTKSSEEGMMSLSWGEHGQGTASLYANQKIGDAALDFSFEVRRSPHFSSEVRNTFLALDPNCFCFPEIESVKIDSGTSSYSIFGKIQNEDTLFILQNYQEKVIALTNGTHLSPTDILYKGVLLGLNKKLSWDSYKVELFADWNRFYFQRNIQNLLGVYGILGDGQILFEDNGKENVRLRVGSTINFKINQHLNLIGGIELERRSTENNKFKDNEGGAALFSLSQPPFSVPFEYQSDGTILLIESGEVREDSLYFQSDYNIEKWRLVIGARYVDNQRSGDHIAPRFSVVYKLNDEESLKFLVGEGFNSPSFRHLSARNQLGLPQNNVVNAEIIESIDLAYNYTTNNLHQVLSIFKTRANNLIQTTANGIENSPNVIERNGIEYEFNYKRDDWFILGNVTYLDEGFDNIISDPGASFTATWMAKVGGGYQYGSHFFGSSMNYISERNRAGASYPIHLKYEYLQDNYILSLNIGNLFDQLEFTPDMRTYGNFLIQSVPERQFSIGIETTF